jgi:hypothetical protein
MCICDLCLLLFPCFFFVLKMILLNFEFYFLFHFETFFSRALEGRRTQWNTESDFGEERSAVIDGRRKQKRKEKPVSLCLFSGLTMLFDWCDGEIWRQV